MAKVRSPEISDPYLGKMYGNILDKYDNPTYNLRFYLKPEKSNPTETESESENATDDNSAASDSSDQRQDMPEIVVTAAKRSKKEVTLAQTGVTATQIDDLQITVFQSKPNESTEIKFRIVQPGAANFLDQIQYGRKYLGADESALMPASFTAYLDIKFLGYDHDPENNEEGGEPTQIGNTVTYKITVTQIGIRVSSTGSEYMFTAQRTDTTGYNDMIYKFPINFELRASTITEAFADLEKQYNEYLENNSTQFDTPDKVVFDMSGLIGSGSPGDPAEGSKPAFISDEKLITPDTDPSLPDSTAPVYDQASNVEETYDTATSSSSGKTGEQEKPGIKISIALGDTVYKATGTILGLNKEFTSKITRQQDIEDPGNSKVDDQKTFIMWYDIHCNVENMEWDKSRNAYAKKYTYTPYLTEDARSDIALTTTEFDFLKEKDSAAGDGPSPVAIATKRLQDLYNAGVLHKSYFYIFTGLNDQIIDLDISFDEGITLLMPPKGGMIGDFTLTKGPTLSNQEAVDKDMTLGDELEAAKEEKNKESLVGLFKKIKGLAGSISDLATGLGKTVQEIETAVNDATGAAAQKLADTISGAELDSLLKKSGVSQDSDPDDVPSSYTEVSQQTNGNYAPEVSGFLYSSQFVQPDSTLTAEEIEASGLIKLDTAEPVSTGHPVPDSRVVPSPLSGMAVNSPAGILMGYAYRARQTNTYLMHANMTIRGDPYWLSQVPSGTFKTGKTDPDQTAQPSAKPYYFLLTIGQPFRYDFVVDDEDANTGYWGSGTSTGMLSGLYNPTQWINKFSGGIFTTTFVETFKEMSVPLQWIRPLAADEEPVNWDDLGVNSNTIQSYIDDIAKAGGATSEDNDPNYSAGSQTTNVNVAATPQAGGTPSQLERVKLAEAGLNIGGGPNGTVTQAEIEMLGQFTTVPRPTGNKAADAELMYAWAKENGIVADENAYLKESYGSDWYPSRHSGRGHAEDRAFDLNLGSGIEEAKHVYAGYRFDRAAKALEAAGWNVVWRSADHYDHIHVEAPRAEGN